VKNWIFDKKVVAFFYTYRANILSIKWNFVRGSFVRSLVSALSFCTVLELELIQTQMAQKPMLRAEVGMRVRCANKASAE
jgi:hypothetical protein